MKIQSPKMYIRLGGRLRYLAGRKKGNLLFGDTFIYSNLVFLRDDIEELGLVVSLNLFDQQLPKLIKHFDVLNEEDDFDNKISESDSKKLSRLVLQLEDTITAESENIKIATFATRKYKLEDLIENTKNLLGSGIYNRLTDLAKHEINCAGKCIAFQCATASAFHILRCTEECLRVVHRSYFPRKDVNKTWGSLLHDLKNKARNPKPDDILLTHLDHLRDIFRNPTDHPEKIYDLEEAEDLLSLAVDVINRCMKDKLVIKKLNS